MNSYSYALGRLKKFNDIILNNRALRDKFILGDYNFLQIYQALIFNDFKFLYDEEKSSDSYLLSHSGINFKSTLKRLTSILASVLGYAFLIFSRRRILVYASDKISDSKYRCDFRMANLYRQLSVKKTKFIEILHTAYDENFYSYLFKRGRPALYLESADFFYKLFKYFSSEKNEELTKTLDLSSFGEEAEFMRLLLKKYIKMINKTRFRIKFWNKLLKLSSVKILICVPDARNYHELIQSCRLNKIKTYAFQSGALCKYDIGLLDCSGHKYNIIKPDKFFLFSRYWINELLRLNSIFDRANLAVGGDIKEDRIDTGQSELSVHDGITVLASYETQAPKAEVRKYIEKILNCPNARLIFSIRPGRDIKTQFSEYGLENMPDNFSITSNLEEIINDIDVVVGTQSTLLYDMVRYLKPIIVLKTEMDMLDGMTINGLAELLDIDDINFCEHIRRIKETKFKILTQRKARLYEDAIPLSKTLNEIL